MINTKLECQNGGEFNKSLVTVLSCNNFINRVRWSNDASFCYIKVVAL